MPSLVMWTIYDPPDDYPRRYIVRRWLVEHEGGEPMPDPDPLYVGPDFSAARGAIPPGAETCMPRTPSDEPSDRSAAPDHRMRLMRADDSGCNFAVERRCESNAKAMASRGTFH
jgi:hypothetical protein